MKPAKLFTAMSTAALCVVTTAVSAKDVCMPSTEMEATLVDWYGETPVKGTQTDTTTIWASEQTGSWTLVQYLSDGQSCVLAQGSDWDSTLTQDLTVAMLDTQS